MEGILIGNIKYKESEKEFIDDRNNGWVELLDGLRTNI